MLKRSRKKITDINIIASQIVESSTKSSKKPNQQKNPAAVALGRLGGQKGGLARAKKLTAKKRKEIAQKAANARWGKKT